MHSSLLPYATQYAVEQAANALDRSRQALREKQRISDRAGDHALAAGARAERLQAKMRDVKYAERP